MHHKLPKSVQDLINELGRLPGIGPKTAQRLTLHMLRSSEQRNRDLSKAVVDLKAGVRICTICFNLANITNEICTVCDDITREKNLLCVVEDAIDLMALESMGDYKGQYHVLEGIISPLDGIGPDDIRMKELIDRVRSGEFIEVILATNPTLEGETTAMYIQRALRELGANFEHIKVTRIARGLPTGGDLEYADHMTLSKALEGRREF